MVIHVIHGIKRSVRRLSPRRLRRLSPRCLRRLAASMLRMNESIYLSIYLPTYLATYRPNIPHPVWSWGAKWCVGWGGKWCMRGLSDASAGGVSDPGAGLNIPYPQMFPLILTPLLLEARVSAARSFVVSPEQCWPGSGCPWNIL